MRNWYAKVVLWFAWPVIDEIERRQRKANTNMVSAASLNCDGLSITVSPGQSGLGEMAPLKGSPENVTTISGHASGEGLRYYRPAV